MPSLRLRVRAAGCRPHSLRRRTWFMLITLVALLAAFVVAQTVSTKARIETEGDTQASEVASLQAARIGQRLTDVRTTLNSLAKVSGIATLTRGQCSQISLASGEAVLNIVDRTGHVICSSEDALRPTGRGPGPAPYAGQRWLNDHSGPVLLEYSAHTPVVGGTSVQLVRSDGKNLIVVPFNLSLVDKSLDLPAQNDGRQLALVDGASRVIFTRPHRPPRDAETVVRAMPKHRLFASVVVPGTDWHTLVTVNWNNALAPAIPQLRELYLAAGLVLLFALVLVFQIHRFILRPLSQLSQTMKRAIDDPDARSAASGTSELVALAEQFNTLLDARGEGRRHLAEAIGQLVNVREDEKRALVRALHEDTIQSLIAARFFLEGLSTEAGRMPSPEDLALLRDSLDAGIEGLRAQTFELMPVDLQVVGLVPAISKHLEAVAASNDLVARFDHDVRYRLPGDIETLVFRTVQECLRNVVKHAKATQVWVTLAQGPDRLSATVGDNGHGFAELDHAAAALESQLGVVSMRETVALAGGRFHLETSSQGTTASFAVPLPHEPDDLEVDRAAEKVAHRWFAGSDR